MTTVYRLVRAARRDDALSGEGARRCGGRWNPPGSAVVYASESRALAVLETFVHLTMEARTIPFLLFEITLPRRARIQRYGGRHSPRQPLSFTASQDAGRAWVDAGATLAFAVPSVLVPQESNYVLNVRHGQFARLDLALPEPFSFDERLWRSQSQRPG